MANPTLFPIQTITVGSGGSASVTFSSIPQTYTDLLIKISARDDSTGNPWSAVQLSFNGLITSRSDIYAFGNGSTTGTGTDTTILCFIANNSDTSNTFGNGEVYIPNYTSANNKPMSINSNSENNATTALISLSVGSWSNTSAITSITLTGGGTILQYSTFTLYGIRNN